MFPLRYFATEYFPGRYFPSVGGDSVPEANNDSYFTDWNLPEEVIWEEFTGTVPSTVGLLSDWEM